MRVFPHPGIPHALQRSRRLDTQPSEIHATEEMEEPADVPTSDESSRTSLGPGKTNLDQDEQMAISREAAGPFCVESGMVSEAGTLLSPRLHFSTTQGIGPDR